MDLLAATTGECVDSCLVGWRKTLGARLIVERTQERRWNVSKAASEAKIDPGTVRRIEAGGNYEIDKLERYATALGRPLEAWLREVLAIPDGLLDQLKEWSTSQRDTRSGEGEPPTPARRQVRGKKLA